MYTERRLSLLALLALAPLLGAATGSLHPPVVLRDSLGSPVVHSGGPVSPMLSCGECHDTRYIAGHSDHTGAGFAGMAAATSALANPLAYDGRQVEDQAPADGDSMTWLTRLGRRHVGGSPTEIRAGGALEMDCFLCHLENADPEARRQALAGGHTAWANTATLARTGLVEPRPDGSWNWLAGAFDGEGRARGQVLIPVDPPSTACGPCHLVEHRDLERPLQFVPGEDLPQGTRLGGVVFSPQRIRESGLNLAGKDGLDRAWDIHAERGLDCVDCHHSLNNPVYFEESPDTRPGHLAFDARRLPLGDYLRTPSHNFARGHRTGPEGTARDAHASMRRCESCHVEENAHDWLPFARSHFNALSCEACHIPRLHSTALRTIDWSLPLDGQPRFEHRGAEGDPALPSTLIGGYEPVLLPRTDGDGRQRLAPFNLVGTWYWTHSVDGERTVLALDRLDTALRQAGHWRPDVLALLDANRDGRLEAGERTPAEADQVRALEHLLAAAGIREPRLVGQLDAVPLSHGVTGRGQATRECAACHARESRVTALLTVAADWPGGVLPTWNSAPYTGQADLPGTLVAATAGLVLQPGGGRAWILGHHSLAWVQRLGVSSLLAVLGLIGVHGGLRWRAHRRRVTRPGGVHAGPTRRVTLYSRYERFWHWLQALAIAGLIFTGLTVHAPGVFAWSSFATAVAVHNILGFVLLANALFSLFHHVAGGGLRQYLPTPRGFFNQAIRQLRYYTKGIFRGEPHPFEKTPGKKLNPLQKVAYLVILNLLLPFQILSGIAIWGAQHWPGLAGSLGGLGLLVPLHSLGAWLFASFLVMHIYLTTTGHTVASNLKAMVSGYENLPRNGHGENRQ